jgi:hypothetical protein
MSPPAIVAAASMREYFLEAVRSALDHLELQPNEATATYLVDLLCDYAHAPGVDLEQALAVVLAESLLALPEQSMSQLKRVGDQSLYVAGFFSDRLRRSQIDPEYYVLLGATAYRRLTGVLRRTGRRKELVGVYSELGQGFARFVQVLSAIRSQGSQTDPTTGIADLYEEWLRTDSEAVAKRLQAAGVFFLKRPRGDQ